MDGNVCTDAYGYVQERVTDGGTYRRSTLSLSGRKKVAEVDGGAQRWWTETAEREGVWLIFIGHKFAKIFERDVDGP